MTDRLASGPIPTFLWRRRLGLFVFLLVGCARPLHAHPFELTDVDVHFTPVTYQVDITFHVDAMLADVPLGDLSERDYARLRAMPADELERRLEMARRYFAAMVGLRFDGRAAEPIVTFPRRDEAVAAGRTPAFPGHLVRLQGVIAPGARRFTFSAAPVFNLIVLKIHRADGALAREQVFGPLEESRPFALDGPAAVPGRAEVASQYVALGFTHILPKGLDHILFVVGLYLLSVRLGPLLWQITAFSAAHTLTLALSMYGLVRLPASIVEPLIALSIAYVAIENLLTSELKPWRPFVVFGFGLLHGLGFAGALGALGLPRERFLTALLGFNGGVELGQLAVIALAFLASGWFRPYTWYRSRMVVPASALIALLGSYWAVVRTIG